MFSNKNNADERRGKSGVSLKDIFPKVLSIVAALTLWFYVVDMRTTIEEKVISGIPVVIQNFDAEANLDVISGKEHTVEVTVSGIKNEIEKITQNDIVVTADMNGINAAGNYKLDLNVTTPSGISVIKKSSTEITVTVDKTTSRSIPIKVDCSDYVLDSSVSDIGTPNCLPTDYIQVTGPQKIVDSIDRMLVKLNIDVIKESINYKNCTVVPVDKNGNVVQSPYIKLNQATVDVHIPVYKEAEVEVIPVYSDELNYIISYSDFSPKIVTIRGTVEAVNSVDEIYTETIDVEKAKPVINASLNIPSGITVTDKSGNPVHSVRINGFEVRPLMTVENKPEIDE